METGIYLSLASGVRKNKDKPGNELDWILSQNDGNPISEDFDFKYSKGGYPQFPLQKTAFSGPYLEPPFLKSCIRPQMRRTIITLLKDKISTDTYDDWVSAKGKE